MLKAHLKNESGAYWTVKYRSKLRASLDCAAFISRTNINYHVQVTKAQNITSNSESSSSGKSESESSANSSDGLSDD